MRRGVDYRGEPVPRPSRAQTVCRARHYWCREHEQEVCERAPSYRVKHETCKLTLLEPADATVRLEEIVEEETPR